MFNYATQRHLSHLLLIDTEPVGMMQSLVRNAGELYQRFCEIARMSAYDRYTLALVFPESRTDLAAPAAELESEMKQLGVKCRIHAVPDADMFLMKGKAGLLSCSLWAIAGATLVNDQPIPVVNAGSLLSLANRSEGMYPLSGGLNAAMIGNATSIGPSLLRLPENHNLSAVLQALGAGDGLSRSATNGKRKWWQFWK